MKLFLYTVLLLIGMILNTLGSNLIVYLYPERPLVPDLLFSITPLVLWTQYLSDPILIISFIVFLIYMIRNANRLFLEKVVLSFTFIHYLRAILIPLTPMGRFSGDQPYGIFPVMQYGMFPSGHTAAAFLLYLLIPSEKKHLKYLFLILFLAQVVILITSRGHYSIDIAGGMMIAYISSIWANNLHKTENKV